MSIVKDMSLAESGRRKIQWVRDFMPALSQIEARFLREKPFQGLRVAVSVHLEAKTANLGYVLKQGGAEVYLTGSNPLSTQDDVAAGLASLGVETFGIHGVDAQGYEDLLIEALKCHPHIVIDDGGDLVNLIHNEYPELIPEVLGGCEETTTGIIRLKAMDKDHALKFPMVLVNDADCKHLFDNRYGTGQSVWDGINRTTNLIVAGKNVVVAGYGWCGKGVAMRAKGLGADVIVTEIDPIKAMEAVMDGFKVMPMREAAKVLFREFGATAWAVAHDVKMQVEFNPALVASYRLVGYESRLLESEDFNDDRRDAGEIGAGHCVTALYELIPVGVEEHPAGTVDALRYQGRRGVPVVTIPSSETLAVKVRYKLPGERRSRLMQAELVDDGRERLTGDFAFAAAVAMYGQLLRLSDFRGGATWDKVICLAQLGLGNDPEGYRREFIDLVRVAQSVCGDRRSEYPVPEPAPHSAPDAAPRSVSSAVSAPASAPGGSSGSVPASASVPVPSGASGSAAVPADR